MPIIIKSFLVLVAFSLNVSSVYAETQINGFGEVRLYTDPDNTGGAFQMGPFDLFLTKSMDKQTSFLVELVVEGDDSSGEMKIEAERMYVQHDVNNWVKVAGGRFHTALGYWNETFHHGSYLATAASRPVMYRFEDEGGLLPIHTIGVEVKGNGVYEGGNLGYVLNIGNGRGGLSDPPQNISDRDNKKSMSGVLYYEKNGTRYGINAYADTIPDEDSASPATPTAFLGKESIVGAHFVWKTPKFEWLNEMMQVSHSFENHPTATDTTISAFYSQFSYELNLVTPYVRIESVTPNEPDPYLGINEDTWYYTLGLRYDLTGSSSLKLEIEQKAEKNLDDVYVSQLNWSFAW